MTEAETQNPRFCVTGVKVGWPHVFRYNGKVRQSYTCWSCALTVSKLELKEATDA